MDKMALDSNKSETLPEMVGGSANLAGLATENVASWLALGAVAGPVLFTLTWLILGFLSPGYTLWGTVVEPYSPISQPVSGLGLGPTAPFMNAAFVLGGFLIITGAIGIFRSVPELSTAARWTCTVLLALTGLGMAMSGIFTLEMILPHTIGFVLGVGTPVVSFVVLGLVFRRIPRWRRFGTWLLLASPVTLVLLVASLAIFDPTAAGAGLGIAGLVQRILITEVLALIAAMGWKASRGQ